MRLALGIAVGVLGLLQALPAVPQEPRLVRVEVPSPERAESVQLRAGGQILAELEVPELCAEPCHLLFEVALPLDLEICAASVNAVGEALETCTRSMSHFPTFCERADVTGDGVIDVLDILAINAGIYGCR